METSNNEDLQFNIQFDRLSTRGDDVEAVPPKKNQSDYALSSDS